MPRGLYTLRPGDCIHCAVWDLIRCEIFDDGSDLSPSGLAALIGQALGEHLNIAYCDPGDNKDLRDLTAANQSAAFTLAICKAANVSEAARSTIFRDAEKVSKDIVFVVVKD